jgi:predicted nucleic acid-binding protein
MMHVSVFEEMREKQKALLAENKELRLALVTALELLRSSNAPTRDWTTRYRAFVSGVEVSRLLSNWEIGE